jgi:RNA polymerase sigma factor (sigma-70 family)
MTAVNDDFVELLERHRGILHKVTNAYCREQASRQDLAQEIVLQLWRAYGRYDRQLRFSTWMYRIAMNVAISHFRAGRTRMHQTLALDDVVEVAFAESADAQDDARLMYDMIAELDELNRALTVLYLDGHSHDEIGTILGLTPTNVATRVNRIKEQLRTKYMERTQ